MKIATIKKLKASNLIIFKFCLYKQENSDFSHNNGELKVVMEHEKDFSVLKNHIHVCIGQVW